jgi:hypothetical protein
MKILGILLAMLGGVLKMIDPYHLNLVSDSTSQMPGMIFPTGIGYIPPAILVAAACGFLGDGRMAGVALLFVSIMGIFFDGGLLIAMPFVGSLLILWAANAQTSTPNS